MKTIIKPLLISVFCLFSVASCERSKSNAEIDEKETEPVIVASVSGSIEVHTKNQVYTQRVAASVTSGGVVIYHHKSHGNSSIKNTLSDGKFQILIN
jgi:hypothetical protein